MKPLIIGTRGSPLALAQSEIVKSLLRRAHPPLPVEIKIIKTSGDIFPSISLTRGGGKGLFTKEIEEQLLAGEIDVAVHSMKDLPTSLPDGLCIGAVTEREDPRDVLITKEPWGVTELPQGGVIASSSIRRKAQVLAVRPDLHVVEIRGNLDTRLRKLGEHGDWHATILAAAGLNRLGLREQWPRYYWQPLGHRIMIPAVGQGAIACEIRADDPVTSAIISSIDHPSARACTLAERAFLRAWGGGCQVPLAAHATVANQNLKLVAAVFDLDGRNMKRTTVTGSPSDAPVLGERAATVLR